LSAGAVRAEKDSDADLGEEPLSASLRILTFAYACDPEHGSEPGAGWTWSRMLAHLGETWVLTRANNRAPIERALPLVPEAERLHFEYVDLPRWARFWKRGQRGVRVYYLLWQLAAVLRARRLEGDRRFDVVWHLTFANAWLGSLAPLVGRPFVYGPVGGGVAMPWRLLRGAGLRATLSELERAAARFAGRYLNPASRFAWCRASMILVQNYETAEWLPKRRRSKAILFQNAVIDDEAVPSAYRSHESRLALFAGRLIYWKGAELAIQAIARAARWGLVIHGTGPEESKLRQVAAELEISDRISFAGSVDRETLLERMRTEFDVFLFPSLHDEAAWVVAEAVGAGLPVICIDRGGPPLLAGSAATAVECFDRETIIRQLAQALTTERFPDSNVIASRARELTLAHQIERLRQLVAAQLHLGAAQEQPR
jgi:glycosyltransferase involved in cell wall biosynthesis